ncbi:hypothetical protein BC834DRAFT_439621 [Gloeopeniophorella convolvens]|nr:hypothetical protein BC834DRAFT_439621 [Gloeopeniophorella convolvens]
MSNRQPSPTNAKSSISSQITAFGAKLTKVLTGESPSSTLPPVGSSAKDPDDRRSVSRGRSFQSSGRGGAGNIHTSSPSRDPARPSDGPDDFSVTRGREPRNLYNPDKTVSTGRGGAGNIRSPSRDVGSNAIAEEKQAEYEKSLVRNSEAARAAAPRSSGRGGAGNIARPESSQSPSRSRERGALAYGANESSTSVGSSVPEKLEE